MLIRGETRHLGVGTETRWQPEPAKAKSARLPLPLAIKSLVRSTDLDSGRFALSGVLIEVFKGCCAAVATDGRHLVAIEWQDVNAADRSVIVSRETLQTRNVKEAMTLAMEGDVIHCDGHAMKFTPLDGRFPRWRDVIPLDKSGDTSVTLDARFVRNIASIAATLMKGTYPPLSMKVTLPEQSSTGIRMVSVHEEYRFTGVVMPVTED